ncbi:MAG TPA: CPBP family intramembrane glutamic endopeptidase [Candidatus Saccharimonadales bacterium]|nr:CPBP family intramembrane glutamic endopeptidase [Candidatus Saccharimonadales bacterium]
MKKLQQNKSESLGSPWQVILVALAIFLFCQFVAAFVLALAEGIIHPHQSVANALDNSAPVQFFYVLLAEGLAAALTIYIVKKVRGLRLATIGLGRRPMWSDIGNAAGGAIAFYLILVVASFVVNIFAPDINTKETQNVGFNTLNTSLDQILAFSALVFLPPIGEEVLMRGYLYSGLRARWRFIPAMLVTSLLFGVAHLWSGASGEILWIAGIDTFLLSLVLVYMREKTGALYAGMMIHALNNMIAFFVQFHS